MPWTLTVRAGAKVKKHRFAELSDALDALERNGRELERAAPRDAVDAKFKRFEAVQQVSARIELAGPQRLLASVHAGIDVRGDGSTEPYRGRIRREVIAPREGENSYDALRRALAKD